MKTWRMEAGAWLRSVSYEPARGRLERKQRYTAARAAAKKRNRDRKRAAKARAADYPPAPEIAAPAPTWAVERPS